MQQICNASWVDTLSLFPIRWSELDLTEHYAAFPSSCKYLITDES